MQIHQLNNYNGNLGSGAFLAIDDGLDTGKVSAETLLSGVNGEISQLDADLNARIDNIIAGDPAPSEAEIIDARLGADSVAYPSLGAAIRGQIENISAATRNLLNPRLMLSGLHDGVTYKYEKRKFTANGTAESSSTWYSGDLGLIAGETYTFCAFAASDIPIKGYIRTLDSSNSTLQTELIDSTNAAKTITLHANTAKTVWSFGLVSGQTYSNFEFMFQCVKGSLIGEYIPYFSAFDAEAREDVDKLNGYVPDINTIIGALDNGRVLQSIPLSWYQGEVHNRNYYNPSLQSGTIYSSLIKDKGIPLYIEIETGYKALVVEFDEDFNYVEYHNWITEDTDYTINNPWASIEIRPSGGGSIIPSEGSNVSISYVFGDAISTGSGVFYVSPTGSDSNNGLTRSAPFKTIQKAINSGGKVILVKEGTYTQGINLSGKDGVSIVLDHYYDTYTVITDEDNPKIVIDGNNTLEKGVIIADCTNCNFGNIEVKNTTTTGFTVQKSDGLRFDDCIAHDIGVLAPSNSVGGFIVERTNADFYNCMAYNIGTTIKGQQAYHCDGFNIHYTGTTNFINCKAWNCEDDGISHHDACCGLIDGGEWYYCGKGGIASPTHGAKINISNVYCHDNNVGIYAGNYSAVTDRGNLIFSNCVCKNNDNKDLIVSDYYKVIAINCIYDTITGSGNVIRFGIQ